MDLHAGQIQGFFNIPVDNLYATPVLLRTSARAGSAREPCTVVSPDAGGVERARAFAKRLDADLAIIDKRRAGANEVAEMHIIGEVARRARDLVDDMVDTAGTLCNAAQAAIEAGAHEVIAACTHAVLSGPAIERIEKSSLKSSSSPTRFRSRRRRARCAKVTVLSVAHLHRRGDPPHPQRGIDQLALHLSGARRTRQESEHERMETLTLEVEARDGHGQGSGAPDAAQRAHARGLLRPKTQQRRARPSTARTSPRTSRTSRARI